MKKLKRLRMAVLVMVLAVAMVFGSGSILSFAATPASVTASVTVPSSFEYGKTYTVNNAEVTAPNGQLFTGAFTAEQVGIYTVTVKNAGSVISTYSVKCTLPTEYELRVNFNGAEIPTIMEKGSKFTLPGASVYKKNDDGEFVKDTTQTVKVAVDGVDKEIGSEFTAANSGSVNVHYYTTIAGGKKYISKDFSVKVQDTFKDNENPFLNVVHVPTEISLKTKITLPTATATDDFDENIKFVITVTKDGKAVKEVEVDDNGFGKTEKTDDVVFDNDKSMSFYPMETGTYQFTYQAFDDSGKASAKHTLNAKCLDSTAPTLKNIEDSKIPTTWGLQEVKKADPTDPNKGVVTSNIINFPYPEYVDNTASKISVSFEIKDTVNNQVVIKFNNIYDQEGAGSKYVKSDSAASQGIYGTTGEEYKFSATTGFDFDFTKYTSHIGDKTKTGKYTVTYRPSDEKNSVSKVYDINLEEKFQDLDAPNVELTFDRDYIYVGATGAEMTVPTPVVSDTKDSRPSIVYTFKSGDKSLTLKGGEKAKFTADGKLVVDKEEIALTGNIDYSVVATDDVGNSKTVTGVFKVLKDSDFVALDAALKINSDNLTTTDINESGDAVSFKTDRKASLGSLEFVSNADLREYVGFELSLYNPNGILIDGISLETYFVKDTNTVHVDNIEFIPSSAGVYKLVARNYTITGKSVISTYDITVEKGDDDDTDINSAVIGAKGEVNVTYTLKNTGTIKVPDVDPARKYVVRRISNAGRFGIMGNQFTAYTEGTYIFEDGYYNNKGGENFSTISSIYNFEVSQSKNPVFELQGKMPTYSAKNVLVNLPSIIAGTDYANAKVTVQITDPDLRTLTDEEFDFKNDNSCTFTPSKDGEYTVVYTASVGASEGVRSEYKIKVGDVIAPSFTTETHLANVKQGVVFKFNKISVTVGEGEKVDDYTFTKKLIAPDNSVAYTVSGKGQSYADKVDLTDNEYKFSTSGTYTVVYEVTDKVGNTSVAKHTINVSGTGTNSNISVKVISSILIIVAILLIAGVLLYFIRFRKHKV